MVVCTAKRLVIRAALPPGRAYVTPCAAGLQRELGTNVIDAIILLTALMNNCYRAERYGALELRGGGEGREFRSLVCSGYINTPLEKLKSSRIEHKQCGGASPLMGTGWVMVMVHMCEAWGSSTVPFPVPRINKGSTSHPLANRGRREIHLILLCSYPK